MLLFCVLYSYAYVCPILLGRFSAVFAVIKLVLLIDESVTHVAQILETEDSPGVGFEHVVRFKHIKW